MKKLMFLVAVAFAATSCGVPARLVNSASHKTITVQPVSALIADLDVSPNKITHFMIPSKTVVSGGYDNVVNSAVREALLNNGNADVLVALETQVKYNKKGEIESITVSGYPAKYTNFRSPDDSVWTSEAFKGAAPKGGGAGGSKLFKLFGKK